jgi:hypothetical protein
MSGVGPGSFTSLSVSPGNSSLQAVTATTISASSTLGVSGLSTLSGGASIGGNFTYTGNAFRSSDTQFNVTATGLTVAKTNIALQGNTTFSGLGNTATFNAMAVNFDGQTTVSFANGFTSAAGATFNGPVTLNNAAAGIPLVLDNGLRVRPTTAASTSKGLVVQLGKSEPIANNLLPPTVDAVVHQTLDGLPFVHKFVGDLYVTGSLRIGNTAYGNFPGGGGSTNVFDEIFVNTVSPNIDGFVDFSGPARFNSGTRTLFQNNVETTQYVYADLGMRTEGAVWARGIKASEVVATPKILNTSDIKTKTRLTQIDNALDRLGQIAGYTYTLKSDGSRRAGVVAQDVEQALPEAVEDVDGTLHVDHGAVLGLLVQAVNDLRAEVAEIRALVAA